jgi:hypothetical protein
MIYIYRYRLVQYDIIKFTNDSLDKFEDINQRNNQKPAVFEERRTIQWPKTKDRRTYNGQQNNRQELNIEEQDIY